MTDDNTLDRRSVLRMTGGTVAASTLAVGSVTGQTEEECTAPSEELELAEFTRTENSGPTTANGDELPVVAGGGLLLTLPTESFSVPADTGEFSADEPSGCYEYRIDVEMTWNPTDSGPTNAGLFLYEGQGLEKCVAKNDNADDDIAPQGENRVSLSVQGSDTFDGENAGGNQVSNDYTVGPSTYTMGVQGRFGVADFEATATAYVLPVE